MNVSSVVESLKHLNGPQLNVAYCIVLLVFVLAGCFLLQRGYKSHSNNMNQLQKQGAEQLLALRKESNAHLLKLKALHLKELDKVAELQRLTVERLREENRAEELRQQLQAITPGSTDQPSEPSAQLALNLETPPA